MFSAIMRELSKKPKRLAAFLLLLPQIASVISRARGETPDVVHAFWGHWPSVVPALAARYSAKSRTSMHMGAYDLHNGFPLRYTAKRVDHRLTHSISNFPRITEMHVPQPVHMVHRGIPVSDLSPVDNHGKIIEKVPQQFCTASALVPEKNVDVVIRVFAAISKSVPSATLLVAGDGPERDALEQLASDLGVEEAVTFLGYVKRQDLFKVMCASECFLFFSKKISERLPNVVKEAMLAECLCFVSNSQGIEELIPSEHYGQVFPNLDVAAVAQKAISVLSDRKQCRAVRENARSLVALNFSSESSMRKYIEIWTGASEMPTTETH